MAKKITKAKGVETLYSSIRQVIEQARGSAYRAVNFAMVQAYWHIGKLIIEEEQSGKARAEYGEELIKQLSHKLVSEYGKGFTETNLKYMRQFYSAFGKSHALRDELSWTHYRLLLKLEREDAKDFYMQEAIEGNWNLVEIEKRLKNK